MEGMNVMKKNMLDTMVINNEDVYVSSKIIADAFEKDHQNVTRKIWSVYFDC